LNVQNLSHIHHATVEETLNPLLDAEADRLCGAGRYERSQRPQAHCAHKPNQAQHDGLYGPRPGLPTKPVVIVLDNGPIHVSKATTAAPRETRAHWLIVEWLPKYAPELNDIEVVWHDLKAHHLGPPDLHRCRSSRSNHPRRRNLLNIERNVVPLVILCLAPQEALCLLSSLPVRHRSLRRIHGL